MFNTINRYVKRRSKYLKAESELMSLTDRELKDIGITRHEIPFVLSEAMQPQK